MEINIRPLISTDWLSVKAIYESGIATGIATFEEHAPRWEQWHTSHLPFGRLVAEINGKVVGWAALSPVSDRCVYGGVAEVSAYVHPECRSKGIGKLLITKVINESEQHGIWTLNAAVFPENTASLFLFKKTGFREIGYREKIAKKQGEWKNNVLLERRSRLTKYN